MNLKNIDLRHWPESGPSDPDAAVLVCRKCGERGAVMSRAWNYDDTADPPAWDPQPRHFPQCEHHAYSGRLDSAAINRYSDDSCPHDTAGNVVCLLADLMQYCENAGLDWNDISESAHSHYLAFRQDYQPET